MKVGVKMVGPKNKELDFFHSVKYRGKNEDFREAMNRIAAALQDDHDHYMSFRSIILNMRFMPAGRVQAAMGSLKNITPYNCFVMPTIHDSFTDGPTQEEIAALGHADHPPISIMHTGVEAAKTMRQGGGVGYDISTLRPSGDVIRGVQSTTDGPMAFAPIYDAICRATSSAGNRRGAQMLVMRADHPDIESFIRAKQATGMVAMIRDYIMQEEDDEYRQTLLNSLSSVMPLRGFNLSVGVTDELIDCVLGEKPFPLKFGGKVYREVDSLALWEMIMRGTYDWAEPGVLFLDTINRMNNLWYCEHIAATNPCGEQPLPPYGACLLGSINLVKYLSPDPAGDDRYEFDWDQLRADIPWIVRSMDNVIDRARYPLDRQRIEAKNKRRLGLGVTGLANCIEAMGARYGDPEFLKTEDKILHFVNRHIYLASVELAKEKGSFPLFDAEKYCRGEFIKTLDEDVQEMIAKHGIRNSHLTSIAPTGTISFCADNVSSGIEPVMGYQQKRRVIMPDGPIVVEAEDYGYAHLGLKGKTVDEVTAKEHVDVICTAQKHVDSAVSKTCNVPTDYPWEDFKDLYMRAHAGGAKGCTTYRPNGNYDDVIRKSDKKKEDPEACGWDPETGQRTGACAD